MSPLVLCFTSITQTFTGCWLTVFGAYPRFKGVPTEEKEATPDAMVPAHHCHAEMVAKPV